MDKKKIYILAGLGGVVITTLIIILLVKRRKKKKMVIVKGEYVVPKGTPNMADALHSFERRKSDGFGGRMTTKIKEQNITSDSFNNHFFEFVQYNILSWFNSS